LEAGINLKLGSFRQNGKIPDLSWEAEALGTGANWSRALIEFSLRAKQSKAERLPQMAESSLEKR
jgi:hypothetical protein